MKWTVVSLFLCLGSSLVWATPARFDDHQIHNVVIETEDQLRVLKSIHKNTSLAFVDPPAQLGQQLRIIVSPEQLSTFTELCQTAHLSSKLLVSNVQELMDKEKLVKSRVDGEYDLEQYNSVEEMYAWLDSLAVTYPDIVTRIKGGESYEGRSIEGVKLAKNADKPTIFIDGNIHAREWITSAVANWIINELLTSTDPEVQALLDNYTWYIFPMLNPDGYEYSRSTFRMWRKTRTRHGLICFGTDANRNFDFQWDPHMEGSSDDPCDDFYAGTEPNSEIEVKSISEFMLNHKGEIKAYFAFHSAINMLLTSWGYTSELPEDHDMQMQILEAGNARLFATHGMVYQVGTFHDRLYAANGLSSDWAKSVLGANIAYTFEFRDQTEDGEFYQFLAPPEEIRPNAEEILQAIIGVVDKGEEFGLFD